MLHGADSDLVIAAARPITMTVTSVEVTRDGHPVYEITGSSFQLADLYDDATGDGVLQTLPAQILSGNDSIHGSTQVDGLFGFAGDDQIDGDKGGDNIDGGLGKNTLTGGKGADNFYFESLETSDLADHITDFKHGKDRIALLGPDFDVLQFVAGDLKSSMFRIGTKAKDGDDHVIYNSKTGALFFDDDGNGIDAKVKIAVLDHHPTLTNHDVFDGALIA